MQFNFEGKYDIVKFIKLIQKTGMYVVLRIGPFIEAEWNFGYIFLHLSLYYVIRLWIGIGSQGMLLCAEDSHTGLKKSPE